MTHWFMDRALRHGDVFRKLALFRVGAGEYERLPENHWSHLDMEVHEHPVLDGTTGETAARMEHHDDRDRRRYLDQHKAYARWEARRYFWLREAGRARMVEAHPPPEVQVSTLERMVAGVAVLEHGVRLEEGVSRWPRRVCLQSSQASLLQ